MQITRNDEGNPDSRIWTDGLRTRETKPDRTNAATLFFMGELFKASYFIKN